MARSFTIGVAENKHFPVPDTTAIDL